MKIVCDRGELLDALTGVSRAVSSKSSIPAIEGILFRCTSYVVMLTGYDLEIGITTSLAAEVSDPGEIVINARLLIEMVKRLDAERITIETNDDLKVVVRGSNTEFNIIGMPASDFPEMALPETDDTLKIAGDILRGMIGRTIYAVSTSDQKPVHTGTRFVMDNDGLTLVSVDGYRLAVCCKHDVQFPRDCAFVVPAKTLHELSKLVPDTDDLVSIGIERRTAIFRFGGYTVVTRLLEGDFLDYARSIPPGSQTRVIINTASLIDCVERASLMINDRFKSPIRMVFEDNMLKVTCATALGNAYDELPCEVHGDAVEIGFNHRYVLDALRYCGQEEVVLELGGPLSPMKMLPLEGDEFLVLVLPVRIKADL